MEFEHFVLDQRSKLLFKIFVTSASSYSIFCTYVQYLLKYIQYYNTVLQYYNNMLASEIFVNTCAHSIISLLLNFCGNYVSIAIFQQAPPALPFDTFPQMVDAVYNGEIEIVGIANSAYERYINPTTLNATGSDNLKMKLYSASQAGRITVNFKIFADQNLFHY